MKVPRLVLPGLDPFAFIAESFQIGIEPLGDIGTTPLHEGDLFVGNYELFQIADLLIEQIGEARRIDRMISVHKLIFHLCPRIILNDRTAHREFIKVVIGKMPDNLSHFARFNILPAKVVLIFKKNKSKIPKFNRFSSFEHLAFQKLPAGGPFLFKRKEIILTWDCQKSVASMCWPRHYYFRRPRTVSFCQFLLNRGLGRPLFTNFYSTEASDGLFLLISTQPRPRTASFRQFLLSVGLRKPLFANFCAA